ncbi:MAG: hypothetical protein ABI068_15250 [Ktedonobacterales bacterium]
MAKKRRHKRGQAQRVLPVDVAPREGWGLALEVGGVTQSVSVPESSKSLETGDDAPDAPDAATQPGPGGGYWGLMLPEDCPSRALLLGLGGGTVAHLLARRSPTAQIIGVEHDAAVLALARDRFGLADLERQERLTIIHADAFAWVAGQAADMSSDRSDRYDLICLDLFEGGRLAQGALATLFLRQVAALLAPQGTLAVNLMVTGRTPEQLHRLRRVFIVTRELRLRGNLVVHLRLPTTEEPLEELPVEE